MNNDEEFRALQIKSFAFSLLLYAVLCFTSFVDLLYNMGVMSWESQYDILGSSFVQNVLLSTFYRRLGYGWLLLLILIPVIVGFKVVSWRGAVRKDTEGRTKLCLQLIGMNALLMALLAPLIFAGLLNNIRLLSDSSLFSFLTSGFMSSIYDHEVSWVWMVFPFLILGPIILTLCARSWYEHVPSPLVPTTNFSGFTTK